MNERTDPAAGQISTGPISTGQVARDDIVLPFVLEDGHVRGRILRLGAAADRAIAHHAYPESVTRLLGEALALAALFGASLKFEGTVTVQTRGDGALRALIADYITPGTVRAVASLGDEFDATADAGGLLGNGSFAVTIDPETADQRYQGIVELGPTLAQSALRYFEQSEQIPTALRIAVGQVFVPGEKLPQWRAGGILVQRMPGEGGTLKAAASDDDWQRVSMLVATVTDDELIDPLISPERLAWRLFHADAVRVFPAKDISFGCRCSRARIVAALKIHDRATLDDLATEGRIIAACEFCGKSYDIDPAAIA